MKKNKSTDDVRTWGEKIAAYRKQAKITQLDLSLRTGITRDQISRLERGKRRHKLETILRIEKALNIPGWSLIEESVREAALGDASFEDNIIEQFRKQYQDAVQTADAKNRNIERQAEEMRMSILGKDSKTKDVKPLDVVDAYIKENNRKAIIEG